MRKTIITVRTTIPKTRFQRRISVTKLKNSTDKLFKNCNRGKNGFEINQRVISFLYCLCVIVYFKKTM